MSWGTSIPMLGVEQLIIVDIITTNMTIATRDMHRCLAWEEGFMLIKPPAFLIFHDMTFGFECFPICFV